MGTLTANSTRLPTNCEHKLPTSCRLSSIPSCCACADERAHAPTYSTYIDGIGFVPRGNRWQRYCWYCKEFWENRVNVSGLRPAQTRIPEVPDQREFLERWYEFHRGYRIVSHADGREERVAVLGEDFREVSPGCLPRTLEEMRAGRRAEEVQAAVIVESTGVEERDETTLDETLDQMLADAADEEDAQTSMPTPRIVPEPILTTTDALPTPNIHAQAMTPAGSRSREYQLRRVAALRRELNRMRSGIERVITGLRELGEPIQDDDESVDIVRRLDTILETPATNSIQNDPVIATANPRATQVLSSLQERINAARDRRSAAREALRQNVEAHTAAMIEIQASNSHLQQLQREQRTMENYTHVFGSREEVVAQGENYVSPIGNLFSRAYERFRAAEDVRVEQRTLRQVLEDEERIDTNEAVSRRLEELETRERDVWGVPRRQITVGPLPTLASPEPHASVNGADEDVISRESANEGGLDEDPADPDLTEQLFTILREQELLTEQRRRAEAASTAGDESFDEINRNTMNAILEARARMEERNRADPPPGHLMDQWWHEDAEMVIRALTTDEQLRTDVGVSTRDAAVLLAYFIDDMVSESDRTLLDSLLRNPVAIWGAQLPTEWLRRQTDLLRDGRIEGLYFTGTPPYGGSAAFAAHHNPYLTTEIAAQAYVRSGAVRRLTNLTSGQRLQMLVRFQAGQRTDDDLRVLALLNSDDDTRATVQSIYLSNLGLESMHRRMHLEQIEEAQRNAVGRTRREDATPTSPLALAAGRQAMQTGPQALIEQMAEAAMRNRLFAEEDAETQAAFSRLQEASSTGYRTTRYGLRATTASATTASSAASSPASSRSSSPSGLDARESGRPEPKTDAQLQVSMECKVCYTQLAEIACLPCGHLVMCRWCSEQHSPCYTQDPTRPRRPVGCPVCRKGVRQKVRVYRG
ncbi:hypothetical protein BDY17DRAFT_299355 [Neohortaea acidophila]|uniref:RING-type domain-containing protein n=1 Tax=Neohortaea acidophila TaxID=245834 RepID=A0A6A6PQA3_9PEZI|nr:uncharacterized protein BDY17DRAFT_299355 [Neohortaea acidophila]KAF2481623.1 hypothetical protein BDY17DRAFT_299355 [Neohortaea acidophila]